jgi:hypothetical protein
VLLNALDIALVTVAASVQVHPCAILRIGAVSRGSNRRLSNGGE